jgi:hypothetical protein
LKLNRAHCHQGDNLGIDSFNFLKLLGGKFGITAAKKKFGSGFSGSVRDIPLKYVNRL